MTPAEFWFQGITALIAVLAFGLSLYNTIERRCEKRPRLDVSGGVGLLPTVSDEVLYIFTVRNPGDRAITVSNIQIVAENGWKWAAPNMPGTHPMPCRLEPGESANYWLPLDVFQQELRQLDYEDDVSLTIRASEGLGNTYERELTTGSHPEGWHATACRRGDVGGSEDDELHSS